MDILRVSALYHTGGTILPLWLAYLAAALLLTMAVQPWLKGRSRTVARSAQRILAGLGLVAAAWLVVVELAVFHGGCPLCLVASLALLTACLLGWQRPRWRTAGAVAVLFAAGLGYLFPFGTVPKVFAVAAPPAGADGSSAARQRGQGPLLVQEFGDFQCHACAQMDRTLERLLERHGDRIRVVFRHLPLRSIHPLAEPAALASECAAAQGRFWDTKRLLFGRQPELASLVGNLDDPSWDLPDVAGFRACVEGRRGEGAVQRDVDEAHRLGLHATPSVLIGDLLVVGSTEVSRLEAVLELAEAAPPSTPASLGSLGAADPGCTDGSAAAACGEPAP